MQFLPDVEETVAPAESSTPPEPPAPLLPRTPNHAIRMLIAMNAIVIGLILIARSIQSPQKATTVPIVRVQTGTLERTLRLTGSTVGENSVTLLAPYLRGSRTRGGGSGRFHLVLQELVSEGSR